jgi:hypothetical protein
MRSSLSPNLQVHQALDLHQVLGRLLSTEDSEIEIERISQETWESEIEKSVLGSVSVGISPFLAFVAFNTRQYCNIVSHRPLKGIDIFGYHESSWLYAPSKVL